jgi:hypothetical protein
VLKVVRVIQVQKVHQEQQVLMGFKGQQELMGHKVLKGI